MAFHRQGAGREREPDRDAPVELRTAPAARVLELQRTAGNRAVSQLIAAGERAIQRQPPSAATQPAAAAPVPARWQGPASAPTPLLRSVLPIASIPQLVAARAAIEGLQPGAQVTVALGPAGVPVDHAEQP